jgi:predicted N-acyltransferase
LDHQVIAVIEQNKIRGTIEKTYALTETSILEKQQAEKMTADEHIQIFSAFLSNLNVEFMNYIKQENRDLEKDGLGFRQASIYVTDEEFKHFLSDLRAAFEKVTGNEPAEKRKRKTIASILIPEKESRQSTDW